MPELPEVETIRLGLTKIIPGNRITGVTYDFEKSFPNAKSDVDEFLLGSQIKNIKRRGKALLVELDTNYSLVIHLKMTGQLVYVKKLTLAKTEERFGAGHPSKSLIGQLPDKSTRVIFELNGSDNLFFNDQRKFGWVRLLPTAEVPNIDFFKTIGPEPLGNEFTASDFATRLNRRPNSSVKAVILDQTIIAGVGNIYSDESLWAAKIHPATLVKNLSEPKISKLFNELRKVLKLSILRGGSTDRNYVDALGNQGSYLSFAKVFRRQGQACPRCDRTIEKIRVAGRGTHICPHCQKLVKDKS